MKTSDNKRMKGSELIALRLAMNLTQEQVADKLGVKAVTTISRWEREVAPIHASSAILLRMLQEDGYRGKGPRKRGGPKKTKAQKLQEKKDWAKDAPAVANFSSP